MSRVAAVRNAFRPRPPGPVTKYTPEQIFEEEVNRMGEPMNKDALRATAEKWIMAHPRQTLTAREIRSALSIPSRNMSAVRSIGEALRRLCKPGKMKGSWTYRPDPVKRRSPPEPEDTVLLDFIITVKVRPHRAVLGR